MGQYGYSYSFNKSVFFGALEGKVTALDNEDSYLRIKPKVGTLFDITDTIKTYAEIGLNQEIDGKYQSDLISKLSMRFGNNEHYDFRFSVQTEADTALLSLEHSFYW